MSVYQGDFLGFRLGDDHSYGLNITRVSTSDRYQDNLLPAFTDATVQVPGGDGTYYWNTYYTSKTFNIDFAFDDLRDEDLRKLRQMFSYRGVKALIFDEFPYKKYMVKCVQPPQLKYLCFDHLEFRIYKGEGNVQLIAYYPFAFGVESPAIFNRKTGTVNNTGDLPANLKIRYNLNDITDNIDEDGGIIILKSREELNGPNLGYLKLEGIERIAGDSYILINNET